MGDRRLCPKARTISESRLRSPAPRGHSEPVPRFATSIFRATPTVREGIPAGQARTTLRFWIIFDGAVVLGLSHVARPRAPAMGDAERGDRVRVVTRPLVPIFTPDWSEGDQT